LRGKDSVAFQLANAGYDVWMGNNRGNRYARKNYHLNPDKDAEKFFDFSFFELGEFDAPAQIDFVLKKTGKSKIAYVGHSQGTS
jgi:pimeloyl-ACP methyl ester carboxylesterase